MSEDKTILLSIKLDTGDLKKRSEEASANLLDLKKRQSELDKTTKEGALAYAKLNVEIKAQSLILNQSAKAIEINERLGHKQNLTLKEQGELLSAGKTALRNLTSEQIANTESGKQLNKEVNDLNESLKKSEAGYGVHVREVGNYDKGIRGLKAELKDLKSIMVGLDAGSKEYQQASERAGELGDKIKEVNENVKASSGGTGFEKLSNNLGLVKDNLMNLDFAGVSENMKQMAVISKGMTFKEIIGGLKNMGSSLISLGKAILANPLFLMVGAIVAVVGALKMWSDYSAEQAVKAQEKHTKAIENNIKSIQDQRKWLEKTSELELKRAELEGKSAEEVGKLKLKYLRETNQSQIKEQQQFQKLAGDLSRRIAKTEDEDRKADLQEKMDDAEQSYINLFNENQLYEDKKRNLIIENNNAIREENKIANEKILADTQKAEEDRLAIANKIKDLILDNEDLKNENQSKIIEAHYKFLADEQNKNDENQKALQEQLDAGLITEAEFKTKKSELDATFKATESKLKTEAFQKEKQANIIKATMNTALGITGALPNVPLSILAGILGAAQIGLIVSQPTPKFAKGGLFGGNSHANGGTKGYFEDGTQIEVEKDESFFILNKRATPLISQLSNINTATGGVPLMANGGALKFANGGAVASSLSNNLDNQLNAQNQLMRMIELMPKPVVVVQDINDAQGNLASVENRANF